MRQFIVVVHEQRVVVSEQEKPLPMYDVSANVDGDKWRYRIKRKQGAKLHRGWRERGNQQAYYHARNSGHHVTFDEVYHAKRRRQKKIHANQLPLFD